jgi:hypothetical protein
VFPMKPHVLPGLYLYSCSVLPDITDFFYCSLLINIGSCRGRSRGSEGKVKVLGSSCSMHCQTLQLMEAVCLLIHHITYCICYDGLNWKLVEVEESAYRMGLRHAWGAVSASWHRSNKSSPLLTNFGAA